MRNPPTEWALTTIGGVCAPIANIDPRRRPLCHFRYIDIGGVSGESHKIEETRELLGSEAPSRARQLVQVGDTLLSTVRTYQSKTAIVPAELDGATASTGFCVLRPTPKVDPRFLFYRTIESKFVADVSARQTGSSYPAVRDKDVLQMPLLLPPLAEQRRIVDVIEEQFSHLDAAEAGICRIKVRLEKAIESAFISVVDLRDTAFISLGEVADVVGGIARDANREADPTFIEVPYLRVANVQRGILDLTTVTTVRVDAKRAEKLKLVPGDVLFNEGGDRDKLGRGWVWEGQIERCIHQNHVFRARLKSGEFDPRFVSHYGNTFGRGWFERNGKQTTNLASLNLTTLKSFPVPLLGIQFQRDTVDAVERQLSLYANAKTEIERAHRRSQGLRRAILEYAFAGRLFGQLAVKAATF